MAGHSSPKDGVLLHAYVPAISLRDAMLCQPKRDARHKAGHDVGSTVPGTTEQTCFKPGNDRAARLRHT
jgi:hypothetical protein